MTKLVYQPIEVGMPEAAESFAQDICQGMFRLYEKVGFEKPWIGYLAFDSSNTIVGTCAFKSPPQNGIVEIAYATSPNHQGKGIATLMAQHLVSVALERDANLKVIAQTLPEKNASNHLLQKIGFHCAAEVKHPEDGKVWEWHYVGH